MRVFGLLVLVAGCGSGTDAPGHLKNGLTGEAIGGTDEVGGLVVAADAKDPAAVGTTCIKQTGDVKKDGSFTITGLCLGQSAYALHLSEAGWWLADTAEIGKGAAPASLELTAYLTPDKPGVYLLSGGKLSGLGSISSERKNVLLGSDKTVSSPDVIPDPMPTIGKGDWLVLAGPSADQKISPLVPSGRRQFGDPKAPIVVDPWYYIATRFKSDTEIEPVEATPSSTVAKVRDGTKLVWIKGDALPDGLYGFPDKGDRWFVLQFGAGAPLPSAASADAGK